MFDTDLARKFTPVQAMPRSSGIAIVEKFVAVYSEQRRARAKAEWGPVMGSIGAVGRHKPYIVCHRLVRSFLMFDSWWRRGRYR